MDDSQVFAAEFSSTHYIFGRKDILKNFIEQQLALGEEERAADIDGTYKLGQGNWALICLGGRTTRYDSDRRKWVHSHVPGLYMYSKGEGEPAITVLLKWLDDMALALYGARLKPAVFAMDICGGARNAVKAVFPDAEIITDTVHMLRAVRDHRKLLAGTDKQLALEAIEAMIHRLMETSSEGQFLQLAAVVRQEMEIGLGQGKQSCCDITHLVILHTPVILHTL
jgi:hypothetical protein